MVAAIGRSVVVSCSPMPTSHPVAHHNFSNITRAVRNSNINIGFSRNKTDLHRRVIFGIGALSAWPARVQFSSQSRTSNITVTKHLIADARKIRATMSRKAAGQTSPNTILVVYGKDHFARYRTLSIAKNHTCQYLPL